MKKLQVNIERDNLGEIGRSSALADIRSRIPDEPLGPERLAELAHLERLSTIGMIAAAIIHELNQPLASIMTNAETCAMLLQREDGIPKAARRGLAQIISQTERAGEMVGRLRDFLCRPGLRRTRLSLNQVVRRGLCVSQSKLRANGVRLSLQLSDEIPETLGDSLLIEQVIVNLVLNAVEAMKKMEDLSERMLSISTTGVDGDMVEVAVCDTGGHAGDMDAERMFQAFYTSKQEGLGVGLWLSRTIIEAHGGSLTAHHNTNRGMTFRIAVPAICERGET